MTVAVRTNVTTYATTHVATNMLRSLKQIIQGCGLDPARLMAQWALLENGVATWLASGHLQALVLEVFDSSDRVDDRRGRFDFTIDYCYYADGDGELWLDPRTVRQAILKAGSYPSACDYRFVADTAPSAPRVEGWSDTTLRSTAGMTRRTVGTAIGGGSLGASLAYYTRS
jgi:HORMA domain-containing protein